MLEFIKMLKAVFLIVRLVDVSTNTEYYVDDQNNLIEKKSKCFEVWNKKNRCHNCISSLAYKNKTQYEKFEFIGDEAYYVIAKYIEIDGKPYVLEMVNKINSQSFVNSIDQHLFSEQIQNYQRKLYIDPLTGAYNRLYFEEQVQHLNMNALALFDVDHFKSINDTYGHLCGDEALHVVGKTILNNIRSSDVLIRYGGDEFLIIFANIPEERLTDKLESLRKKVEQQSLENWPDTHITISIGGITADKCDDTVLKKLDERLYKAKINRNCIVTED